MEIVISDTNILIDLFNAGLLPYCKMMNLKFRTLDLVINEVNVEEQLDAIQKIIEDGTLKVVSLSNKQIAEVFSKIAEYKGVCNLSPVDISVMVYALENNCRILTGDRTLKTKATLENIKVSGILYITDMLNKDELIGKSELATALRRLLGTNSRLPKRLIMERIKDLSK